MRCHQCRFNNSLPVVDDSDAISSRRDRRLILPIPRVWQDSEQLAIVDRCHCFSGKDYPKNLLDLVIYAINPIDRSGQVEAAGVAICCLRPLYVLFYNSRFCTTWPFFKEITPSACAVGNGRKWLKLYFLYIC